MRITQECYDKYITPYEMEDMFYEEDKDIIIDSLLTKAMILLGKVHDTIQRNTEEENELAKHREIFNLAKDNLIESNFIVYAICNKHLPGVEKEADKLANMLGLSDTSYYDSNANIFEKVIQISKFTNRNTLHSMVINAISGEKYNIDINIIREKILTTYLGISRILNIIEEDSSSNIDSNLLELLIYYTSLNILFNVEQKELVCQ